MISIKGKEIRPETISMWFNFLGFVASIIFYLSVEHNISTPTVSQRNPAQDSLISINAKLQAEISRLQAIEKTLLNDLQTHTEKLAEQQQQVSKQKQKIYLNVHSSWDNLTKSEQDAYTNKLIQKFKNPKQ